MKDFAELKFTTDSANTTASHGEFTISPLERGFGNTLGNSLRRVMLSSLPGIAIYAIVVEGAQQEFTALEGVVEDLPQIILNLKQLVFKSDYDLGEEDESEERIIRLHSEVEGELTGNNIECPSDITIINKDVHICTLARGGKINITMHLTSGRGFVIAETNKEKFEMPIGFIPVDSNFSPVRNVAIDVTPTRVRSSFNYDSLKLTIDTDGSIKPEDALSLASSILASHFEKVATISKYTKEDVNFSEVEEETIPQDTVYDQKIEDLNLPVRAYNCIKREGLMTVRELCSMTEDEVIKIKNLGKKSFDDIKAKLIELGLSFK